MRPELDAADPPTVWDRPAVAAFCAAVVLCAVLLLGKLDPAADPAALEPRRRLMEHHLEQARLHPERRGPHLVRAFSYAQDARVSLGRPAWLAECQLAAAETAPADGEARLRLAEAERTLSQFHAPPPLRARARALRRRLR